MHYHASWWSGACPYVPCPIVLPTCAQPSSASPTSPASPASQQLLTDHRHRRHPTSRRPCICSPYPFHPTAYCIPSSTVDSCFCPHTSPHLTSHPLLSKPPAHPSPSPSAHPPSVLLTRPDAIAFPRLASFPFLSRREQTLSITPDVHNLDPSAADSCTRPNV